VLGDPPVPELSSQKSNGANVHNPIFDQTRAEYTSLPESIQLSLREEILMEEWGLKRGYSEKIQTVVVARRLSSSYSLHFEVQFFSMLVLDLDVPILLSILLVVVLVLMLLWSDVLLTFDTNLEDREI